MSIKRPNTLAIIAAALALGLAPAPDIKPSVWAAENLVLTDGDDAGEKWRPELAPYLVEILDRMSPTDPCNKASVRKPGQVGFTNLATAWMGYIADINPAPSMVVFPTIMSVQDYNRDKFHPALIESPTLARKVFEARSRSVKASTALNKRFRGGFITLTGANSTADLRSKTVKYIFADEIDEWTDDLNGQGDPMEMVDTRQRAYHAGGEYKKLQGSTPTIKGASRIDDEFESGDQRFYHVACPHCGEKQRLEFGGKDKAYGLKFNKEWPFNAHYICRHNGCVIEHYHKRQMLDEAGPDGWIPAKPEPGRHPSYHIDILLSPFTVWDKIAEAFLKAKDVPHKLKSFVNLWLGESWEERGDAPEWKRIFARRETFPARHIPPGGLVFVGTADVQKTGIYHIVEAYGADKQSWCIDAGFLEGDTSDPANEVWAKLDAVYQRRYPDAYGNTWPVDRFGVDSGYNANVVYNWCRARPNAMAIKGEDGWHRAAISTSPSLVDVDADGVKVRRGAMVWTIGTYSLKSEFYSNLRKDGVRDGAEIDPPGFYHLSEAVVDEAYCKQITAEALVDRVKKGRTVREWEPTGPNHYHDCKIYGMALAEHLGVSHMTADDWANLAKERGAPPVTDQGDMLPLMTGLPQGQDETARRENELSPVEEPGFIPRLDDWLRR